MRAFVLSLLFAAIAFAAPAQAQNARATGAQILWYGVYEVGKTEKVTDPTSATGTRFISSGVRRVGENTDRIAMRKDVRFGFAYKLSGSPANGSAKITHFRKFPPPGLDDSSGRKSLTEERNFNFGISRTDLFTGFNLGDTEGMPEGVWVFQVTHNGRILAEKSFTLYRP